MARPGKKYLEAAKPVDRAQCHPPSRAKHHVKKPTAVALAAPDKPQPRPAADPRHATKEARARRGPEGRG